MMKTRLLGTVIILSLLAVSCSSDDFNLGGKFMNTSIRTVVIDTCTVKMTTVTIDSLVTSGRESLLFGRYEDPILGKTECTGYVTFTNPTIPDFPEATIIYDSINLTFTLNGVWYGDTTRVHSFGVYPLDGVIDLPDDGDYYSNWSHPYNNTPVITMTFRPKPSQEDTISVRLPDSMGEDLLQKMLDDNEEVFGNQERFMDYFNGFAIAPAEDNNSMIGVNLGDTSMYITIHYHYSTYTRHTGSVKINPFATRSFYGMESDRQGTPFALLKSNELETSVTGNMALVQGLTASYVKIEFPYLNNLMELGDYTAVTSANLFIYPVKGSYSALNPLPEELSMYISDESDVTVGSITTYSGESLQTGNLTVDDLFNIETYYTYDILSFIEDQLGAIGIYRRNLQLIVPQSDLATTMSTLVAGDALAKGNGVKLKLTYIIYDSN